MPVATSRKCSHTMGRFLLKLITGIVDRFLLSTVHVPCVLLRIPAFISIKDLLGHEIFINYYRIHSQCKSS